MTDLLLQFISTNVPDELRDTYLKIHGLFDYMPDNSDLLEQNINDYLNDAGNLDVNLTLDTIYQLHIDYMHEFANTFGIFLDEETKLQDLYEVIYALLMIEQNENTYFILSFANNRTDNVEALANIFNIVGTKEVDFYLPLITDVKDFLFDKINEVCSLSLNTQKNMDKEIDLEKEKAYKEARDKLLKIAGNQKYNNNFAIEMFKAGTKLLLPFNTYLFLLNSIDHETMNINKTAETITIFAYLCNDNNNDTVSLACNQADLFYDLLPIQLEYKENVRKIYSEISQ